MIYGLVDERGWVGEMTSILLFTDDFDYRVLEIITSVRLREVLQLTNGSVVTIDVPVSWKDSSGVQTDATR